MNIAGMPQMQTPQFQPTSLGQQGMSILQAALNRQKQGQPGTVAGAPPAPAVAPGIAPGAPSATGAQPGGLLGGAMPQGGMLNNLFSQFGAGGAAGGQTQPGAPLSLAPPSMPAAPSPTALTGLW